MMNRSQMIGEIRRLINELESEGRFEFVKEVLNGIDRFNFSGVSNGDVCDIWASLSYAPNR